MKMIKKYWAVLAAILALGLGGTYYTLTPDEVDNEAVPTAKIRICTYSYESFEHRTVAHPIKFGNFPTKTLNITDHYTRPTPGFVKLAGYNIHKAKKVKAAAKPYLVGAEIDSIFNIQMDKRRCYFQER